MNEVEDKFNVVVMVDVIEHLDYAQIKALKSNLVRLLVKGGKLLITTPNANTTQFLSDHFWNNPEHIRPQPEESIRIIFFDDFNLVQSKVFGMFKNPFKIILNLLVHRKLPYVSSLYVLEKKK